MSLFSKNTSTNKPKAEEEKRNELLQKDPALYVAISFFTLEELFVKENGTFTSPTGRIDFWAFLHWFSWDIFKEADPWNDVVGGFRAYLKAMRSYSETEADAAVEYLADSEDELDRKFYPLSSGTELMILCGHAIETLYNRKDALLAFEFSQYLTRSVQIVCKAFPKNK